MVKESWKYCNPCLQCLLGVVNLCFQFDSNWPLLTIEVVPQLTIHTHVIPGLCVHVYVCVCVCATERKEMGFCTCLTVLECSVPYTLSWCYKDWVQKGTQIFSSKPHRVKIAQIPHWNPGWLISELAAGALSPPGRCRWNPYCHQLCMTEIVQDFMDA